MGFNFFRDLSNQPSLELKDVKNICNSPSFRVEKSPVPCIDSSVITPLSFVLPGEGQPKSGIPKGLGKDPVIMLNELRAKKGNKDRIIIGHLNINHVANKFEPLVSIVKDRIDILLLSETKLDGSFPNGQFLINGYKPPYRRDRDIYGGGLLLYVKNGIPCKEIKLSTFPNDIECLFIEINLRKTKYILIAGYNPHKEHISYFLSHVGKELDKLISSYDNILILGDLNAQQENISLRLFNETYNLENLIKEPTCFKNPLNPSSIDVMLTNDTNCYQNSVTLETGLSDFHKMTISVLKAVYDKKKPIKISYRCYKHFDENKFHAELSYFLQRSSSSNL